MKMIPTIDRRIGLFIIVILIIVLSIVILLSGGTKQDKEPPGILFVSGNITMKAGETATILVNFTDDVEVANATLLYRTEGEIEWMTTSIITGSKDLYIPIDTKDNWEYFITVDYANNGPIGNPSLDGSIFYTIIILENNTNNDDDWNETRYILVEEGTAGWCSNCPTVANLIHKAYKKKDIPFYYVSLVDDESTKASSRLNDDLKRYAFPTVYIDGGYTVIVGSSDFDSNFEQKLLDAQMRSSPKIRMNITSSWNETRKELVNAVVLENKDESVYSGTLKIYITEINSRWADWNGDAYAYAFIDYGLKKEISLDPGETASFSEIWNATSAGFSDVVKENLFVIAAVFTDKSEKRYANPADGENPFDAYFCDVTAGTRVAEGTLPPSIGISTPREYSHYLFGSEKHNNVLRFTYIIGRMPVKISIEGGADIEKVEFSISGRFRSFNETDTESPYEWTWNKFSFGKYTLSVKVYDSMGRTDTDSIEVYAFIL